MANQDENSILDLLAAHNVLIVDFENNKTEVSFTEACDYYHEINLNKSQIKKLIEELKDLYAVMLD